MKKYNIIYADPPWAFGNRQYQDGNRPFKPMTDYYQTMQTQDISLLPIQSIAEKDCALFMWVTNSHFPDAMEIIKSWGFKYKTVAFVWVKKYSTGSTCVNYAPWTLQSCEYCLLATKGSPKRISKNTRQLVEAERTVHSKKPIIVRNSIVELMGDLPRIELFARQKTEGWDVWGNEVESDIDLS